jgi:hypothetical protein
MSSCLRFETVCLNLKQLECITALTILRRRFLELYHLELQL